MTEWLWLRMATMLVVAAAPVAVSQAASCSLATIKWIAGSWQNITDAERAQERWVLAPEGVLMGSAWEFPTGKAGFAEIMTIRQDDGAMSMILRHFDGGLARAWEERDAPMVFKASRCDSNTAVFDGAGTHVGEHLTYKRAGNTLTIIGDFLHHGVASRVDWQMVRVGD
jgi:hypothetical protein